MDQRYPIGKFTLPETLRPDERKECIRAIAEAPALLRAAVAGLSPTQLDTPYRPEGWTHRQVVHHVADSHINAYQRFKLALTETHPTIKPYQEALWAEEPDAKTEPVDVSLALLDALHSRWVVRLSAMTEKDFARTLNHPASGTLSLHQMLALYAWHGRHHTAHITSWRTRHGV